VKILEGDCVEVMRGLPDASVDAIVTDPPYGLEFMGKEWDSFKGGAGVEETATSAGGAAAYSSARVRYGQGAGTGLAFQEFCLSWAQECLRVLKPGGHLLAFGGSRTYHRLAVAVEDAGFEVRDQMMWLYGSGFPKSLDVSKAIDKATVGVKVVGQGRAGKTALGQSSSWNHTNEPHRFDITEPNSPDAKKWSGWGTALKPAHEPIVVARKPLVGTVAENVLRFGTGALNVDGCRVGAERIQINRLEKWSGFGQEKRPDYEAKVSEGRWPANLILDEEAGRLLDEQSGTLTSGANPTRRSSDKFRDAYGDFRGQEKCESHRGADAGGASRFFYCAKAGKAERNAGLDGLEGKRIGAKGNGMARTCATCGASVMDGCECADRTFENPVRPNHHPTVKPISLMAYLVRLVTPPNGTVLDPFLGSGTTGCAAALEGFDFIGIEREADYIAIAEARIAWWEKHKGDAQVSDILAAGKGRDEVQDAGQLDLLGDAA
jgi:site-specific DNA-methyltransferase (adenine-specific)